MSWKIASILIATVMFTGCSDRAAVLLFGEEDKEDRNFYASEGSTQIVGDKNSFVEVEPEPVPTATPTP